MQVPGKREAAGGDYVQRDWLVVGPQSKVGKLLEELRRYAVAGKLQWRSGEAKVAMQDRAVVGGLETYGKGLAEPKTDESKEAPGSRGREVRVAEEKSAGNRTGGLPSTKPEPVQRVLIRFRARR